MVLPRVPTRYTCTPAVIACPMNRLIAVTQRHLAGMIASAVAVSLGSQTRVRGEIMIVLAGSRHGWFAAPVAVATTDREACSDPAGGPEVCCVGPGLVWSGPAICEKFGLALNIVRIIPAIMARTRKPAMTGRIIPLLR